MVCSHKNTPESRFCSTCGVSLDRVFCRCGSAVDKKSAYCGQCGQAVALLFTDAESKNARRKSNKLSLREVLDSIEEHKVGDMNAVHEVASVDQDDIDELFD